MSLLRGAMAWFGGSLLIACTSGTGEAPIHGHPLHSDAGQDASSLDGGFGNNRDGAVGCGPDGEGCGGPGFVAHSKLDLLFVVDNSTSMQEEQDALRKQFPQMIEKLVSGDHDGDGKVDHQAIVDLHLAVVSSDMGASADICSPLGDDGVFRHEPNPAGDAKLSCKTSYPTFLQYEGELPPVAELANDFACISNLGTSGCGFESHLESALKALWPASDARLSFLGLGGGPTPGRGDAINAGFLRANVQEAATLAIVVVADEDDCSAYDRSIFRYELSGDPSDPLADRPVNLRCFDHKDKLQPIERYLYGYKNLGAARVVFAGIVGVPVDLVDDKARAKVSFSDAAARDAYYDRILKDSRMKEAIDPKVDGQLLPACKSKLGRADPARRFVQLAKSFGRDALIQSICADDFGPPIDLVVENVTAAVE